MDLQWTPQPPALEHEGQREQHQGRQAQLLPAVAALKQLLAAASNTVTSSEVVRSLPEECC